MAKKRNTRLQQRSEFVHNIRVSSPRIRYINAMKFGKKLLRFGLVLLTLVGLGFAGKKGWHHFVSDNEEFSLTQLELPEGCQVSGARVLEACGIEMNSSVFNIDTDELEIKLEAMPEVKSAEVFVRFPGTLKVDLVERIAVAWIECKKLGIKGRDPVRGLLVDREKTLFSCDPAIFNHYKALPVLKLPAMDYKQMGPGMQLNHKQGMRAYSLLRKATEMKQDVLLDLPVIDTIMVRSEHSLEVQLTDKGSIIFGLYDHERQLKDLMTIRHQAEQTGRFLAWANLIPERNIPVQMLSANER